MGRVVVLPFDCYLELSGRDFDFVCVCVSAFFSGEKKLGVMVLPDEEDIISLFTALGLIDSGVKRKIWQRERVGGTLYTS